MRNFFKNFFKILNLLKFKPLLNNRIFKSVMNDNKISRISNKKYLLSTDITKKFKFSEPINIKKINISISLSDSSQGFVEYTKSIEVDNLPMFINYFYINYMGSFSINYQHNDFEYTGKAILNFPKENFTFNKKEDLINNIKSISKINFDLINNGISHLSNLAKEDKKRMEERKYNIERLKGKKEELQDYLQELEDFSQGVDVIIPNNGDQGVILFRFKIPGIEVENTRFSKTSYHGFETITHDFDEAKLILTDKLVDVMKMVSLVKTRIEKDLSNTTIKTFFKNGIVDILFTIDKKFDCPVGYQGYIGYQGWAPI